MQATHEKKVDVGSMQAGGRLSRRIAGRCFGSAAAPKVSEGGEGTSFSSYCDSGCRLGPGGL